HRRPGERRGRGGTGSEWAEMIRDVSGWIPAAQRTHLDATSRNFLPVPARNEWGAGWGEGHSTSSSPRPSPPVGMEREQTSSSRRVVLSRCAAARRSSMCWLVFSFLIAGMAADRLEPERVTTIIEALTRLGPEKVEANPKLKEALGKVLEATQGTSRFVELVRDFHITDQDPALLEIAANH